jgi:general secretion pathway protein D
MKNLSSWALALVLVLPAAAPAAEETPASRVASSQADNFPNLDIRDLIARVAKRSGKQFIVDPRVRADVPLTGLDANAVDYGRLLAILSVHQFVAFESGGVVRVVPDAISRQLPIPVTSEVPAKALDDEMVSLIVPVKAACSAHMVPVLRPLMPQSAHLAAMPPNTLIVVDRAANARRIVDMVERLDKTATPGTRCGPEFFGSKTDGKLESK